MQVIMPYVVEEFANFHKFSINGQEFVMVDLLIQSPDGEVKELNFQIFTYEKWHEIMQRGILPIKETIGQNIMVGDYYK